MSTASRACSSLPTDRDSGQNWFGAIHKFARRENAGAKNGAIGDSCTPVQCFGDGQRASHVTDTSDSEHVEHALDLIGRPQGMSVHIPEPRDNEFARGIDYFRVSGNFSSGRQRSNSITRDYYRLVSEDVPGPDVDYCGVSKDERI